MKLEDLKPVGEIITYTGNPNNPFPVAPYNTPVWTDGFMPSVGTKLYTLEQLLPIIHEMAREQLKLETELAESQRKYTVLLDYLKTTHDFHED